MEDQIQKLELKITELENKLKELGAKGASEIDPEELKVYHKVSSQLSPIICTCYQCLCLPCLPNLLPLHKRVYLRALRRLWRLYSVLTNPISRCWLQWFHEIIRDK